LFGLLTVLLAKVEGRAKKHDVSNIRLKTDERAIASQQTRAPLCHVLCILQVDIST
jgi:hypothetical protein